MSNKNAKIKSRYAFKHGAYAVAFTAIVIVAIIIVNVLVSALGQRFPLTLDITADKDYSVSSDNLDYIRQVKRPVTITVCSTEGDYATYMSQYVSYYYNAEDETNGKYFDQALTLLDAYTKYNSNIKVVYADPQSPDFADVQSRVASDASLSYGSLLVESTFELDGKEVYRNKVLGFEDLYALTDSTGGYASYYGYGYVISGSKVESAVTSAIYSVTSDKTTEVVYLSGNMEKNVLDTFTATLKDNNCNVTALDNLVGSDIPEETEVVIIAAPTGDFSAEELKKLDAFLDNDGKRGKTLLFFGSNASPDLPNLYDFLSEWGIEVSRGTLAETNANNYIQEPTTIGLQNMGTDFTKGVNDLSRMYVASGNLPMQIGFESQGNRVTTELLASSENVVVKPVGAADDWTTDGLPTGKYSTAILSTDTLYEQDFSEIKSHVVAFSSVNFISEYWTQFTGSVGNMELTLSLTNALSGRDADTVTFTNKTITVESFAAEVTGAAVLMIYVIFLGIVPLALIVTGVVIFIRRRNK